MLAAADAYHAMTEDRPHRPARTPAAAAEQLLAEVDAGRFARVEVGAVLDAAGQERRQGRPALPAGLTEREVDVFAPDRPRSRQQAGGSRARNFAQDGGTHVEHIYTKAGVTTRAGVTLFAMENGLLLP